MPIEEYRILYFGITAKCIHLYLGKPSAKLWKFLYDKAGIEFELHKTDLLLTIEDFSWFYESNATTFANNSVEDVEHKVRVLLESFHIIRDNAMKTIEFTPRSWNKDWIYAATDIVLYNRAEKVALVVSISELLEHNDSVLTHASGSWDVVEIYHSGELDLFNHKTLCELFHKKKFDNHDVLRKKLSCFKKLYIDSNHSEP